MSGIKFDVDAAAARLRSDPAKVANLANLAGEGGNFSNFSNFSRPAPPVPSPRTGLDDWPEHPPEGVDFGAYESAGSLLDLCRRHGLRVALDGGTASIVFPPGAPEALRQYADALLAEGRSYILTMRNKVAEAPEVMQ